MRSMSSAASWIVRLGGLGVVWVVAACWCQGGKSDIYIYIDWWKTPPYGKFE